MTTSRRQRAVVGPFATNQLHYANPWTCALWSFFFPGFGQLILGQYMQGWILAIWEIFINAKSNFNTAIVLSLTGRFAAAKSALDIDWILLYCGIFVFILWFSYQSALDANNLYYLANQEETRIEVFHINVLQYDYIDKRSPYTAAFWSLIMPGIGQLYNRRLPQAVFLIVLMIYICYKSHCIAAVHYTFFGDFSRAVAALNPEWALFLPSIYAFSMYNSFVTAADQNLLFETELAEYLRQTYQPASFRLPRR